MAYFAPNVTLLTRFRSYDTGLWANLAMNLYLVYEYVKTPAIIDTVIVVFYVQSVLIGVFNALDIFTVTHAAKKERKSMSKGCMGLFFMFHYGMFHLVYLFFLPSVINIKNIDWHFALLAFYLVLTSCFITFIQDKWRNRTEAINVDALFFMPYARVVPMHLVILVPKFLNISAPLLFLLLKTLADVVSYRVYKKAVFKPLEAAGENNTQKI